MRKKDRERLYAILIEHFPKDFAERCLVPKQVIKRSNLFDTPQKPVISYTQVDTKDYVNVLLAMRIERDELLWMIEDIEAVLKNNRNSAKVKVEKITKKIADWQHSESIRDGLENW